MSSCSLRHVSPVDRGTHPISPEHAKRPEPRAQGVIILASSAFRVGCYHCSPASGTRRTPPSNSPWRSLLVTPAKAGGRDFELKKEPLLRIVSGNSSHWSILTGTIVIRGYYATNVTGFRLEFTPYPIRGRNDGKKILHETLPDHKEPGCVPALYSGAPISRSVSSFTRLSSNMPGSLFSHSTLACEEWASADRISPMKTFFLPKSMK